MQAKLAVLVRREFDRLQVPEFIVVPPARAALEEKFAFRKGPATRSLVMIDVSRDASAARRRQPPNVDIAVSDRDPRGQRRNGRPENAQSIGARRDVIEAKPTAVVDRGMHPAEVLAA